MALVLVVDDEEIICNLLAEVFRNAGYRVRTAYGGREAMDLIFQESPGNRKGSGVPAGGGGGRGFFAVRLRA